MWDFGQTAKMGERLVVAPEPRKASLFARQFRCHQWGYHPHSRGLMQSLCRPWNRFRAGLNFWNRPNAASWVIIPPHRVLRTVKKMHLALTYSGTNCTMNPLPFNRKLSARTLFAGENESSIVEPWSESGPPGELLAGVLEDLSCRSI